MFMVCLWIEASKQKGGSKHQTWWIEWKFMDVNGCLWMFIIDVFFN